MPQKVGKEALRVILDSNFLFVPSQFQVDVFEELSNLLGRRFVPVLLSSTYEELRRMAELNSPKMRQQALLAIRLAEKCHLFPVKQGVEETPDDVIVRVAKEWRCPVATNDKVLKRRLRDISVPVIYLRQKTRLAIEGSVF